MHEREWKPHLSRRYGRDAKSLSDVDLRGWLQGTPPTCGVLECTYVGKHPPDHAVEVRIAERKCCQHVCGQMLANLVELIIG